MANYSIKKKKINICIGFLTKLPVCPVVVAILIYEQNKNKLSKGPYKEDSIWFGGFGLED